MVAYAYAASYPDKVEKLVVMDAPVPGIRSCSASPCGTSPFPAATPSAWSRGANASTSIASETSLLAIQQGSTRRPAPRHRDMASRCKLLPDFLAMRRDATGGTLGPSTPHSLALGSIVEGEPP